MENMQKKPYALGVLVGRFQGLHAGHEDMIAKAVELCDDVGIFIGSSEEAGTVKNPFSYETRKECLQAVFADAIRIYPLPDIGVGNNSIWGNYVLKNICERFGKKPDLLISGKESRRAAWFDSAEGLSAAELYVPKTVDISASAMRAFFISDDKEQWKRFTNPKLWDKYEALRQIVLDAQDHPETNSL